METVSKNQAKAEGLKRFFTGVACINAHVAERYSSNGLCVECRKTVTAKHWIGYAKRNVEKLIAKDKRHRSEHPDVIARTVKKYRQKNKEQIAITARAYRASRRVQFTDYNFMYYRKDPQATAAKQLKYRVANAGILREKSRAYQRENLGKRAAWQIQRELNKKRATPPWADLDAIKTIYILASSQGNHVDHIIPLNGKLVSGLHVETNLQILEPKPNLQKSNKFNPADFDYQNFADCAATCCL